MLFVKLKNLYIQYAWISITKKQQQQQNNKKRKNRN